MDSKALSVLSMETLKKVGEGESSKIFFPLELTRLVDGISDYMGSAQKVPDRAISDTDSVRRDIGDPDEILGKIPQLEDIRRETEEIKKIVENEISESNLIAKAVKD